MLFSLLMIGTLPPSLLLEDHVQTQREIWKCQGKEPHSDAKVNFSVQSSEFCSLPCQVVFCIHNIAYQGRFAFADFSLLNLPDEFKSSFDFTDG